LRLRQGKAALTATCPGGMTARRPCSPTTRSALDEVQAAYDERGQQFRADLYVTRQAGPLLSTQAG